MDGCGSDFLSQLDLSFQERTEIPVKELLASPQWTRINLSGNKITSLPKELGELTHLVRTFTQACVLSCDNILVGLVISLDFRGLNPIFLMITIAFYLNLSRGSECPATTELVPSSCRINAVHIQIYPFAYSFCLAWLCLTFLVSRMQFSLSFLDTHTCIHTHTIHAYIIIIITRIVLRSCIQILEIAFSTCSLNKYSVDPDTQ